MSIVVVLSAPSSSMTLESSELPFPRITYFLFPSAWYRYRSHRSSSSASVVSVSSSEEKDSALSSPSSPSSASSSSIIASNSSLTRSQSSWKVCQIRSMDGDSPLLTASQKERWMVLAESWASIYRLLFRAAFILYREIAIYPLDSTAKSVMRRTTYIRLLPRVCSLL